MESSDLSTGVRLVVRSTMARRLVGSLYFFPLGVLAVLIVYIGADMLRSGDIAMSVFFLVMMLIFPGSGALLPAWQAGQFFRRVDTVSAQGDHLLIEVASAWHQPRTRSLELGGVADTHFRLRSLDRDSSRSDYRPAIKGRILWGDPSSPSVMLGAGLTLRESERACTALNLMIDSRVSAQG